MQAFADSFAEFGVIPTMDEVRAPMGMLKRDHVRTMLQMERISGLWKQVHGREFTEEDVEAVYLRSESRIMELLDQFTDLKPYVKETVEELRRRGLKIGSTTGYTDEMMQVVDSCSCEKGIFSGLLVQSRAVGQKGRPFPYMIFRNMEELKLSDVRKVMKVGDTVSDIRGRKKCWHLYPWGYRRKLAVGLSQREFEALSPEERAQLCEQARKKYLEAGADCVVNDIRGILELIEV